MIKSNPDEAIPRWWGLLSLVCAAPAFLILFVMGFPDKGLIACIGVGLEIILGRSFWQNRKASWYWVLLILFSALHIGLVATIHFSRPPFPMILLSMAIGIADFFIMFTTFLLQSDSSAPE